MKTISKDIEGKENIAESNTVYYKLTYFIIIISFYLKLSSTQLSKSHIYILASF